MGYWLKGQRLASALVLVAAMASSCKGKRATEAEPDQAPVSAQVGAEQPAEAPPVPEACVADGKALAQLIEQLLNPITFVVRPEPSPVDEHLAALRQELADGRRATIEGRTGKSSDLNRPRGAPDIFKSCPQAAKQLVDVGQTEPGVKRLEAYRGLPAAVQACRCNVDMPSVRAVLYFMFRDAPLELISGEMPEQGLPHGFPMRLMPGADVAKFERTSKNASGSGAVVVAELTTMAPPAMVLAYYRMDLDSLGMEVTAEGGVVTGSDERASAEVKAELAADGLSTNATLTWRVR